MKKAREARKEKCGKIREKMAKERAKADEGYMKELPEGVNPGADGQIQSQQGSHKEEIRRETRKERLCTCRKDEECAGPQLNCKMQK